MNVPGITLKYLPMCRQTNKKRSKYPSCSILHLLSLSLCVEVGSLSHIMNQFNAVTTVYVHVECGGHNGDTSSPPHPTTFPSIARREFDSCSVARCEGPSMRSLACWAICSSCPHCVQLVWSSALKFIIECSWHHSEVSTDVPTNK